MLMPSKTCKLIIQNLNYDFLNNFYNNFFFNLLNIIYVNKKIYIHINLHFIRFNYKF